MSEREARRSDYPLTIPDRLLLSEDMKRACGRRDFGEVFRLVNRRGPVSYAEIAAAVGKMTSARVGDVIRGVRGIRGLAVMERIADGLGIPGHMLGLPERPWEGTPSSGGAAQDRGYARNSRSGSDDLSSEPSTGTPSGVPTAHVGPMASAEADALPEILLVSVHVDGKEQIVPTSRRALLGNAMGVALQGRSPFNAANASAEVARPRTIRPRRLSADHSEAAIQHLRDMWHTLVRADNLFGPRHALTAVHQQLDVLNGLLEDSRGEHRQELLKLSAQYAESAAWLHEDSMDVTRAETWTGQAMEWAMESGDEAMLSWTLFRRSQLATGKKNAGQTIGLAQAVQRHERALTHPMKAAAIQQEAQGLALYGNETACHRKLDEAHEYAAIAESSGDARSGHGDFCTPSYIEIQRANCWLTLSRPERAVTTFQTALEKLPDVYQRDRGFAQARLAMAYAGIQEYEQAAAETASALDVARDSGSGRTLQEAVTAINALAAASNVPAVRDLLDAVKENAGF
ncbi:tetratricopeptide repeat protein [Streptomyces sp. Rer75]|uniref:tetratricopeptide repeat protein n=1 Tax=Streptomyces sp. Rer75 TaxID=2750011 RepID=UPI00211E27BF|nr:tetratricopeptide repeat protein [Streptomyces sp. Rer75]